MIIMITKPKFIYILLIFFFLLYIPLVTYGNTNTREHCKELLNLASQEYSQKNYIRSIEVLTEVKTIAETNNWDDYRLIALNNMGITYNFISDYDKSMECYLDAYEIALQTSDQEKETMLLMNISELYSSDRQFESAKEYCHKALKIAQQINDTVSMGKIYLNLSIIANTEGKLNLAEEYIHLSLAFLKNISGIWPLAAKVVKTSNLYFKKEYDTAEKLVLSILKEYEEEIKRYDHKVEFLILVSKIYFAQNNAERALYFIQEALDNNPTLKERIDIYDQFSTIYWKNNSPDSAWNYKNSVIVLQDSLFKIEVWESREKNRVRFELFDLEKTLAENKAKQKAERTLLISILISIIVLAIILLWVFRIQSIRNKQRKQIVELELEKETLSLLEQEKLNNDKLRLEQQLKEQATLAFIEQERLNNEKLILAQQLKEQETLALLEQEKLNNEIEAKNRQLTAKLLSQSNRHEWIKEMLKELSEISDHSENLMLNPLIRKLKIQLKDSSEWDTFLNHFEEMNPSLLMSLQNTHPNFTANDIQLISCIYLDLDTKKIAYLLNVSVETCRKKKERLASKIGIKVSELRDYFKNIEKNLISHSSLI